MIFVKKYINKKDGSTLILLVMAIAIITVLGVSLLIVTMLNYKIKKANTEIRKSFYISESGLNSAYGDAYELVRDGIDDSMEKVQDYMEIYPLDEAEAENIFLNNYKLFIAGEIKNRIADNSNPFIKITNEGSLSFITDKLTVCIQSKYISKSNIVKTTYVDLIILVPDYDEAIDDAVDISALLILDNWLLSRD